MSASASGFGPGKNLGSPLRLWYEGRPMRTPRFSRFVLPVLALLALAAPLTFVACRQGDGDRCQINSDCQDPLYCELKGQDPSQGGTCRSRSTDDAGQVITPSPDLLPAADMTSSADMIGTADGGDGGNRD